MKIIQENEMVKNFENEDIPKGRIFVDMDGVLAEWNDEASLEEIHQDGYFLNRPPMQTMVDALKLLKSWGENVYILSAYLTNGFALDDKQLWLANQGLDFMLDNAVFVPYGESKSDAIANPRTNDILIDDYTVNLKEWHGEGIKLINAINFTKKTWNGPTIHYCSNAHALATTVQGIRMVTDLRSKLPVELTKDLELVKNEEKAHVMAPGSSIDR